MVQCCDKGYSPHVFRITSPFPLQPGWGAEGSEVNRLADTQEVLARQKDIWPQGCARRAAQVGAELGGRCCGQCGLVD